MESYKYLGYFNNTDDIQRYYTMGYDRQNTTEQIISDILTEQGCFYKESDNCTFAENYPNFQKHNNIVTQYKNYIMVWDIQDNIMELNPDSDPCCDSFIDIYQLIG